jgi:hypothetical protein
MNIKLIQKPKQLLALSFLLGSLSACSWVEVKPQAEGVQLISAGEASNCTKIGMAKAKTLDKIWFLNRDIKKINSELKVLARNEAQTIGGNAIRPVGELTEGQQTFLVYNCN